MRPFLPTLALATTLALPALADITLSAEVGANGLQPTITRLANLPAPTDADRFALGGLRFLGAVEHALQTRWAAGLTDRTGMLPFLRIPLDENPAAPPLDPTLIAGLFRTIGSDMADARAPLSQIPAQADFGVEIDFADIWFDINANTTRDPGEDMMAVLGPMILGWQWSERDPATPAPKVRFDAADAAWLSAYTHLLEGVSDILLAYDPTEPISRIMAARAAMEDLGAVIPDMLLGGDGAPDSIDMIAIVLASLNQTPDAARMAAAQEHFLAMVADNRDFWSRVARETDNVAEWLPNDRQQSALGVTLPQGTGAVWLGVLSDAEAILNGAKLVPYWRIEGPVGVNMARLFTDPRPVDVAGWIQGWAALPYLSAGPTVTPDSWRAFEGMVSGDAMLFTLFLN